MYFKQTLMAAAALILATGAAQASIIAAAPTVTFNSGTGNFDWTYGVTLAMDEQIAQNSHFTLYDFGPVIGNLPYATTGFLATNSANIVWTQAPNLSSDVPSLVNNDPNVNDVRFTYTGTAVVTGTSLGNSLNNLGSFTLESKSGSATAVAYKQGSIAQDLNGLPDNNTTSAYIPAVPEPASLAIIGSALCGLGLIRRRRA